MLSPSGGQVALWAAEHVNLIAWPALLSIVWKFRGRIDEFFNAQKEMDGRTKSVEVMAIQTLGGVNTIQTNHLKHMEANFEKFVVKQEKSHEVLVSIDKNIAVLLTTVAAGRKVD